MLRTTVMRFGRPDSAPAMLGFDENDIPAECRSDPNSTACVDAAAAKGGQAGGEVTATLLLGPEAAPVGAAVGKYVGSHAREWASDVWEGAKGIFGGGTSPCECQLGACNDGGDDTFNHDKFMALAGHCPSKAARDIIEKVVADHMAQIRATGMDVDQANRIEICALLSAYAECGRSGWDPKKPPPPACPGVHRVNRGDGKGCVCEAGYHADPDAPTGACLQDTYDYTPGDACVQDKVTGVYDEDGNCVPPPAEAPSMSTTKKVLLGAGLALGAWTAFALATKRPVVPEAVSDYVKARK